VPRQDRLLLDGLDRHKAHGRLSGRNGDRFGIRCIVLATQPERLDEFRRN
jgi:hypothetical protein